MWENRGFFHFTRVVLRLVRVLKHGCLETIGYNMLVFRMEWSLKVTLFSSVVFIKRIVVILVVILPMSVIEHVWVLDNSILEDITRVVGKGVLDWETIALEVIVMALVRLVEYAVLAVAHLLALTGVLIVGCKGIQLLVGVLKDG